MRLYLAIAASVSLIAAALNAAAAEPRFLPPTELGSVNPQPDISEPVRAESIKPKSPESAAPTPAGGDAGAANFLPDFIESAVATLRAAAKDKTSVQWSVSRAETLAQINADLHAAPREFRFAIQDIQDAGMHRGKHWYMLKLNPVLGSEDLRKMRAGYAQGVNMPWIPKNRQEALAVKIGDNAVMTGDPELGPAEGVVSGKYPTLLWLIPERKNGRNKYALVVGSPRITIEPAAKAQ